MADRYSGGFTATTGFKRTDTVPLDDSTIVELLTDLALVNKPYKLMMVGVLQTEQYYVWNGLDILDINNWSPIGETPDLSNYATHGSAQPYTAQQYFVPETLSIVSSIVAWDCNTGQKAELLLTEDIVISPTGMEKGATYSIALQQDATGGRTVSWGTAFDFGDDIPPVLSGAPNKCDIAVFESNGSKMFYMDTRTGFSNYIV